MKKKKISYKESEKCKNLNEWMENEKDKRKKDKT